MIKLQCILAALFVIDRESGESDEINLCWAESVVPCLHHHKQFSLPQPEVLGPQMTTKIYRK